MKKNIVFLMALALVLYACKGVQQNSGERGAEKLAVLSLHNKYREVQEVEQVVIYPDSLSVKGSGQEYVYLIDKENSFEDVSEKRYMWHILVSPASAQAPAYNKIVLSQQMEDIYGAPDEYQGPVLIAVSGDGQIDKLFDIVEGSCLPRKTFKKYPESGPYPELSFDLVRFNLYYNADTSSIPAFVLKAKTATLEGRVLKLSDGESVTELEIMPLSDYETVYSEGYNWYFATCAKEDVPVLHFVLNSGFDFEKKENKPEQRWISFGIVNAGYWTGNFYSWDNLVRKISVSYPSDTEFQDIMEQGVLPDYSD